MTINPIKPGSYRLGGAQFQGHGGRLFSVTAHPDRFEDTPIEFYAGCAGHRTMLDMSTDDAEALIACLTTVVRLRREAEAKDKAAVTRQARTFFNDSDGALEAA